MGVGGGKAICSDVSPAFGREVLGVVHRPVLHEQQPWRGGAVHVPQGALEPRAPRRAHLPGELQGPQNGPRSWLPRHAASTPSALRMGTMWRPLVMVDMSDGPRESPLKSSSAPLPADAVAAARRRAVRCAKRDTPPIGSTERDVVSYTSLKARIDRTPSPPFAAIRRERVSPAGERAPENLNAAGWRWGRQVKKLGGRPPQRHSVFGHRPEVESSPMPTPAEKRVTFRALLATHTRKGEHTLAHTHNTHAPSKATGARAKSLAAVFAQAGGGWQF